MQNLHLFNAEQAIISEKLGRLSDVWLDEIYRQKWFKLFVPKELGGLECSLPEGLRLEESLARKDGSLGWTVTLCAGAGWFVGFMEEELRKEIFPGKELCLAGSGFVGGKADLNHGEYTISGSWTYASGAMHATHFTANCELFENGIPQLDADGKPVIKAFIIDKADVEILDGWSYMGMIATGSHGFRVKQLRLPIQRSFVINENHSMLQAPVYQMPFLQFAEATLAVNICGIAIQMIELIAASFWKRHEYRKYDAEHLHYFTDLLEKQNGKLQKVRDQFYFAVEEGWAMLEETGSISPTNLQKISKSSRELTGGCRNATALLYPFAGLEAAKTHSELNRVWRDFNTVSQHALLIFPF